jgi:hypothetical protein
MVEMSLYLNTNPTENFNYFNSCLEFNESILDIVEKQITPLLEIEFLSKEVKRKANGLIQYFFNVTPQKEKELKEIFTSLIHENIIKNNPHSLN